MALMALPELLVVPVFLLEVEVVAPLKVPELVVLLGLVSAMLPFGFADHWLALRAGFCAAPSMSRLASS
jgi:hypothetical protein